MIAPEQSDEIGTVLRSCPTAGDGVNRWLFCAARKLHLLKVESSTIEELLERASANCGRLVKAAEIGRAVRNSKPGTRSNRLTMRKWPQRDYEQIEAIGRSGFRVEGLQAHSPVALNPIENQAETIVDALFPTNPLLCAARGLYGAVTKPREEWRGQLSEQQFIVPSPMSKLQGITAEGKVSARALDNVASRRFLVVEFDFLEKHKDGRDTPSAPLLRRLAKSGVSVADLCAALHAELSKLRPLALVLHSGGKSLHGWYPCNGQKEESAMNRFMRFAIWLGADPATWTRCQFVRMPDGRRQNGKRQHILYYNPAALTGGGE